MRLDGEKFIHWLKDSIENRCHDSHTKDNLTTVLLQVQSGKYTIDESEERELTEIAMDRMVEIDEEKNATIQRLKQELSDVSTSLYLSRVDAKRWREEVERLSNQGETARLLEVLKWYGNDATYDDSGSVDNEGDYREDMEAPIYHDKGNRARDALSSLSSHTEDTGIQKVREARERIREYIEKSGYTYNVDEIVKSYVEYYKPGYYVSHTTRDCIENLTQELEIICVGIPGITDGGEEK